MVMDRIGGPLAVREVPGPVAPEGGVVVEVRATGLCRSDWHAWAGHDDIALPHVPGHELAGVIAEVGAGVRRWSAGDRVTVPFAGGCGRCEWCVGPTWSPSRRRSRSGPPRRSAAGSRPPTGR
jgi:alcohol dehydrogenase